MTLNLFTFTLEVSSFIQTGDPVCLHRLAFLKCHLPAILLVLGVEWVTSVLEAKACSAQRTLVEVEKCGGRAVLSLRHHSENKQVPSGLESRGDNPVLMDPYL